MGFSLSVGNFERMRVTENEILYHSFKCFVHLEKLFEKVELGLVFTEVQLYFLLMRMKRL